MRPSRRARRVGGYGPPIQPCGRLLVCVTLVVLSACSKRSGDLAAPQRVDDAAGSATTAPTVTGTTVTTVVASTTSTASASTTSASTTAPSTTLTSPTTPTTARRPTTTRVIVFPPSTSAVPANLTLDVAQGSAPCPALQLAFVAVWSIGNAAPGSGLLAFDDETPRPVPDSGREDRCAAAGTHTYTYSGAVPGGRATRTVTFTWS
jgi:hypothetical protein